ncbi:MAG: WcaI family glycosyltransferase [Alphaproteobacteria bacterium]|nr:WcaI family glycosyltransferase [Alphaproteobacteria bacterium]MBL7099799.1 WcaI family glycosyltransferase [Alphaproteobacteria bacterium]
MKLLISACHFTPDPIGGGKFTGEMAEWLAARGHQVRAVVGAPFYPQWKIAEGYSGHRYCREQVRGVDVLRCPIWVPSRQSGAARMLQYGTLAATSSPVLWWAKQWRPDVIWTTMPPLSGLPAALASAKLAGARSWLHIQDFEIDAAFELGILQSARLRRVLEGVERRAMRGFDVVSTITDGMLARLQAKGVEAERARLFRNWVDTDAIFPVEDSSRTRDEFGVPRDAFVLMYSGNLGEKQGVDDLIDVARRLAGEPRIMMVICGDGGGRARLSAIAHNCPNVRFFDLQPAEKFNEFLGMADVHLLPQKREVADLVMPSKLPGMLASGRPVVAGAMTATQLSREIESCGIVVPPGDTHAMAQAVLDLFSVEQRRRDLGIAAAARARDRWAKDAILRGFETELMALVGRANRSIFLQPRTLEDLPR